MTYGDGHYAPGTPGPRVTTVVITCPGCDEAVDCDVHQELGATDIVPEACPHCDEPWPAEILNDESVEVEVGF